MKMLTLAARSASFATVLSFAAGAACATPAYLNLTAEAGPGPVVEVPFADLDLRQTTDARTLLRRVNVAARQICGETGSILVPHAQAARCVRFISARAVQALGAPRVAAEFAGQPHLDPPPTKP